MRMFLMRLFVVSLMLGSIAFGQGEVLNKKLTHDGLERDYILYVPSSYSVEQDTSLVLNFHGAGGSGEEQMLTSGMNQVAEEHGFLVAYPSAVQGDWSAGDDHNISFTDDLLDAIASDYAVDATRTYATGKSQGGAMSYLLGVTRPDTIAAIASVSGVRVGQNSTALFPFNIPTLPERPIPMMHMHGTADVITPYQGGTVSIPDFGNIPFPSTLSVIGDWAANNGCAEFGPEVNLPDINSNDNSTVSVLSYQNCAPYIAASGEELISEVVHYRVNDAGHSWPVFEADREASLAVTAERIGEAAVPAFLPLNSDINASSEIWQFFDGHQLPAAFVPEPAGLSLGIIAAIASLSLRRRRN